VLSDGRIVNTITAGPLLNLLLALDGMEVPEDPQDVWPVFKKFAAVPSTSELDVIGFQIAWEPLDDRVVVRCSWVRQLRDDAAGYGTIERLIEIIYGYDYTLDAPAELDVWSDKYRKLDDFFAAVEASKEFQFLLDNAPEVSSINIEDLALHDDDEPA